MNFDLFKEIPKEKAKQQLGLSLSKKYIVFIANPEREEKNFALAKRAVEILSEQDLADKMEKIILMNKGEREKVRQNLSAFVQERYQSELFARKYIEMFNAVQNES